jgi:hypothetical protein
MKLEKTHKEIDGYFLKNKPNSFKHKREGINI